MKKKAAKYAYVIQHKVGRGYWTGQEWTMDWRQAFLYTTEDGEGSYMGQTFEDDILNNIGRDVYSPMLRIKKVGLIE